MYPNLWKYLQQQANCYSNKPFATYGEQRLTFDTLTEQVKQLSVFLSKTTDQSVVGIKVIDPLQSISAILATLVTGKAFWPTSDQLIEKTKAEVLKKVFVLDEASFLKGISFKPDSFDLQQEINPETPFCWTTSSGSLATPKITEHSYLSLMEDTLRQVKAHNIGPDDRIDIISSLSFSASLSSLFPALFAGASLHVYDNKSLAITGIYEFWKSERITMTTVIPTIFRPLLNYEYDLSKLEIRFICIGGEPVYPNDIALFQQKFPKQAKLQVAVASSEARSIAEYITDTQTPVPEASVPYASVAQKRLTIVDNNGQPLPTGETGRIAITSKVIGTRYIQGPDAFSKTENGERSFISDDLGSIDEHGRLILDNTERRRLKLKGEFVDLDHLEQLIRKEEGIEDCSLLLSDKGTVFNIIIQSSLKKHAVRKQLNKILGTQSFHLYVLTQELPKTHSGKLDLALLKTLLRSDSNLEYSDKDLAYYEQWRQVFPSESDFEGRHFFEDLGGDSISAVALATRLSKVLEVEIEPNAIYLHPYYEELFNYLKNASPYHLKKLGDHNKSKPNILFFPSLSGVHRHYLPVIDLLSKDYNAFLIQHPPGSGKRYESPDSMAQKCASLIDESPYSFSCFVGHSFSGYLAYYTAHHSRQAVGVILLDSHTYKSYGRGRKRLANVLRGTQVLYQHARSPEKLKQMVKRRAMLTKSKPTRQRDQGKKHQESQMLASYNDFFSAFLKAEKELPQTDCPLGIFRATNASNIRYRLEYDFGWERYNSNIQFRKTLSGEHEFLLRSEENVRAVAAQLDHFIKYQCLL